MIIEVPDENSIIKWKNGDKDEWKSAEISDLIKAYEDRPQSEWIPVSERLPQNRDWYLGIFKEPDTGYIIDLPFICDYVGNINKGTTNEGWILRRLTDSYSLSEYYKNLKCVAWQPLPAPYKGGGRK